jgi:serine/threonine protein kinase
MQFDQLGPYRIVRKIGRGGMGTVYQGTNVENGQPAAIKVLSARLAVEEGFRERFETEIETLKKLKHPNIVRLYGFGEQADHLYFAMELVAGTNLEDELQAGRRFTWRETTQLGIKLARALKHAHDHGVIHRDLKPANLLLTEDTDIKLADFGIARLFGNTRLTSDGGLIGTAEYMAPEQADGRPVTFHCDLYSLGGVLFAMLAGRPPFRGGSLPELLQYHRLSEPPRVSRFAADVPDELDQIILRLLSKDPPARATSALVVAKQLSAMEHALSLPPTRIVAVADEDESPDDARPRQPTDGADHLNVTSAEPGSAGSHDDFSINMARTLADPHQDPEATDAGLQVVEPSAGDQVAVREAPARPESASPMAAGAPLGAKSARGPSAPSAADQLTLSGAISRGALANDELPRIAPAAPIGRFTTVEEDEQRRADARRLEGGPVWAQIAALAVSLLMIIGLGWYFMRPPSADVLFQRIESIAADDKPERLLDAEDDIRRFLTRFPDDPRGAKLKTYLDEIDLLHLERRVQRLPRQLAAGKSVAPIQRDYVEAVSLAGTVPERAMAKLQAMLDVYGQAPNPPETTAQFLELARRKLKQLQEQCQHEAPDHLAVIDASLREAEGLRATELAKSRAIWSGIIELYTDKPWAAERVARAKAALSESAGLVNSVHSGH